VKLVGGRGLFVGESEFRGGARLLWEKEDLQTIEIAVLEREISL
jgi:hypothetical protein